MIYSGGYVDNFKTVEVRGSKANVFAFDGRYKSFIKMRPGIFRGEKFAPRGFWVISQFLYCTTPVAKLSYHTGEEIRGLIDPSTTNPAGFGYGAGEVRVYNRALSPDEIKRLYNMGR